MTADRRVTVNLTIRVRPADPDSGFVGEVVEMPGVMSQGETEGEAVANTIDALNETLAVRSGGRGRPTWDPHPDSPTSTWYDR